MKQIIWGWICVFVIFLSLTMGGTGMAKDILKEPDENYLVREDVNIIQGFYFREYSIKQDGVVDFKTARQIIISEYNEHWNSVVHTVEWPLFYWVDEDRDGTFDHFVDQGVQGQPEDIVPYLPVSEP